MLSPVPVEASTRSIARSITSRLRSPRKSIFSSPSASTSPIGNWVTISASAPFCCSGRYSVSGRSPLTTAAAAVLLGHVVDHPLAAGHGEVDVDVGHALAAGVEEPLEQQRVADRVEVGDAQAVGDQRAGRRAAAGADRDAVLTGEADEVPDDQEVVREAHLLDRLQLELEPLAQLRRLAAVALAHALLGQLSQVG